MKTLKPFLDGQERYILNNCFATFIDAVISYYRDKNHKHNVLITFEVGSPLIKYIKIIENKYYISKDVFNKLSDENKVFVDGKDRPSGVVFGKGYRPK